MKNILKKFITCSIATCIIAATALAGACTPDKGNNGGNHTDPTKSGYEITVLYPDDTPVKGSDGPTPRQPVTIRLLDSDNKVISGTQKTASETGTTVINYKQSGVFLIDVSNCPIGYKYDNKVTTVAGRGDYTIKLSASTVSYTLNVKLPNGQPANGVTVTVKQNGDVIKSAVTGADGTAVIADVDAKTYDVEFTDLPEGVSYLPTKLTATTTTVNVELIALKELKLDESTKMSEEKLKEWDKLANSYDEDGNGAEVIRFDKTADCYDFTTDTIPEGKKLYYYFTADEDGEYRFISKGKYYVVDFFGPTLEEIQQTTESVHESTNTCEMIPLQLTAGESYYFSYSIPKRATNAPANDPDDHELSGTRDFMIAKPVASARRYELIAPATDIPANYVLSFDMDTAILALKTNESSNPEHPSATDGGIFEIRSDTNLYDVKIEFYNYFTERSTQPDEVADDISGTDKNFLFTLEVPPSYSGNTYYFKIIIKSRLDGDDVEYPATVPIIITRTGDAEDNVSPVEYKHKNPSVTEKYPEQTGKEFHFLIGNNNSIKESDFVIDVRNGVWYVTVDGVEHELVVAIKHKLPKLPYSYATVEYMGDNGTGEDDGDDQAAETKQNSSLSLYEDPSRNEDRTNTKYNYSPFIEEYSALCNNDGVYRLNNELKEFLEKYYAQHWHDFAFALSTEDKSNCCWLFSCGYYA